MDKIINTLVMIAMLSVPAIVHFGIRLRVQQLKFYGDTSALMKDLMSWNEPLLNNFLDHLWPNYFYYLSPHICLIILAIIFRLHFKLTVSALGVVNLVLILFSFWIYGRAHLPDSPMMWISYLPVEAASLMIFFICAKLISKKGKANT